MNKITVSKDLLSQMSGETIDQKVRSYAETSFGNPDCTYFIESDGSVMIVY